MSSYAQDPIYQQVAQQVADEIAAAGAPIQGQINLLGQQEEAAQQQVGKTFDSLLPYVQGAAQGVQQGYASALTSQQAIYDAANQRLADMQAQRANQAQEMAQKIGGPVALGEFTAGVTPDQEFYARAGAGDLLHALGTAQAGNQAAQQFAGQVFPMLRTEEQADIRNQYSSQRAQLQNQLAGLQSGRTAAVNERYFQRQQQEHQYQLDLAQQQLDTLKSNRDWQATLRSLKNDEARINLAKQESKRADALQKAQLTGKYKGKPTLEAKSTTAQINQHNKELRLRAKEITANINHMTRADKIEAQQLGLSAQQYAARLWDMKNTAALNAQKMTMEKQRVGMEVIDAALNPGQNKEIEQTVTTEVDRTTALLNKKAYAQVDPVTGKTHYFLDRTVKVPASQIPPVQDPQKLYDMLVGYGTPDKMARALISAKLDTTNFTPGKIDYNKGQLQAMPFSQLRGVAMRLGFRPQGTSTRKQLVKYVSSRVAKKSAKK
jgi:hypothetical protein